MRNENHREAVASGIASMQATVQGIIELSGALGDGFARTVDAVLECEGRVIHERLGHVRDDCRPSRDEEVDVARGDDEGLPRSRASTRP